MDTNVRRRMWHQNTRKTKYAESLNKSMQKPVHAHTRNMYIFIHNENDEMHTYTHDAFSNHTHTLRAVSVNSP